MTQLDGESSEAATETSSILFNVSRWERLGVTIKQLLLMID